MTVSMRRIWPNLSYIFSQLFFIRCLIRAPGRRSFLQSVKTSPSKLPCRRRPIDERQEIHASHFEGVIDPAIEVLIVAEGKISLENHSIMATEHGYNRSSEFLCEVRRHGVP